MRIVKGQFTEEQLKVIKEEALAITAEQTGAGDDPIEVKLSNLVSRPTINAQLGKVLAEAFTLLSGKTVTYSVPRNTRVPEGAIVVALNSPNSHGYTIGEPVLFLGNQSTLICMRMDKTKGYAFPFNYSEAQGYAQAWRYATVEEINKFIEAMKPPRVEGEQTIAQVLKSAE